MARAGRFAATAGGRLGGCDVLASPAFTPLMLAGEAYQFDWSREDVEIAGRQMRVKLAHGRLYASRVMHARAYPRETQAMLFDAMRGHSPSSGHAGTTIIS